MSVPNVFAAVNSATGQQLDQNFSACAQLNANNAFSGTNTVPTQSPGDNSTNIASTAYVATAVNGLTASTKLIPITATTAVNAITVSMGTHTLDFRSSTAATGTPNSSVSCSPVNLVIPATSNLGMLLTAQSNRLLFLEAYNSGTPVLCVANLAGGNNFDETTFVSPTTIGAASNSATTVYSAVACAAGSPYRIVGFCDVVFTTGTGWSSPTLVQPCGGEALTAMSGMGYGQIWHNNTGGGRLSGTTYYNTASVTNGKPMTVCVTSATSSNVLPTVGGVVWPQAVSYACTFIVPPGMSYSVTCSNIQNWMELY